MINKNELAVEIQHQITLATGQVIQALINMESSCRAASSATAFSQEILLQLSEASVRLSNAVSEVAKQQYLLDILNGGQHD
jgi:hypothetical protein